MVNNIEDDFKNPVLEDAVQFWSSKHSTYKQLLSKLYGMLTVVDAITLTDETEESVINDFVAGLVLIAHKDEERDGNLITMPDIGRLTKPMLDIVIAYLKSDRFNNYSIKHYIPGDEKLIVDGLEVPITPEKLILWWQVEKKPILCIEDAMSLHDNYVEHRKGNQLIKHKVSDNSHNKELTVEIRPQEKREKIEKYFNQFDKCLFVNEKDQELFIDVLIDYYVKNIDGRLGELSLPSKIIELRRLTKTKVSEILCPIYAIVNKKDQLKHDKHYLSIVQTLNHFAELDLPEIYDSISKNPKYKYW